MNRLFLTCLSSALLAGCAPASIDVAIETACEWTNPLHCMLPWPSDRWLSEDPTTSTGLRLTYEASSIPTNTNEAPFDVEPYARFDGFSPASTMLTVFSGEVDLSGMAWVDEYGESLAADSPSVILDLQTGERVAHFVEVDARAGEDDDFEAGTSPVLLYLHPAQRLAEGRRYGVALRDIHFIDGSKAEASAPFAALRDGVMTTDETLEAARPGYESLFEALEAAGVQREGLTQAWSFTTASGSSIRSDLMALRADALPRVPAGAGECEVTEVELEPSPELARVVHGTFRSPLYMDSDGPESRLVRSPDGTPEFQGWATVPFTVNVPVSLSGAGAPQGRLVQLGHGLLGDARHELATEFGREFGTEFQLVLAGTDWQGMSSHDVTTVAKSLADFGKFPAVPERLLQGMVNQWILTRALQGACRDLEELSENGQPIYRSDEVYFIGISQGGILGGTFLATSPDIERGALLVASMNFPFTMTRSLNWGEFEVIPEAFYERRIDREFLVFAMISLWDLAEPNPWLPHLVRDPLFEGPAKKVLFQVAEGDLKVQTLAADMAVRTAGIPLLSPAVRPVWGLDEVEGPLDSAYVYFDLGEPLPPLENRVPELINLVHDEQRELAAARAQIDAFFAPAGAVHNFCDGPCDPQ